MGEKIKESTFQEQLRIRLGSRRDMRIWRQLVGQFYAKYGEGDYRPLKVGPPVGAADLSGIHIGSGRRVEVEVKSDGGRIRTEQITWRNNMIAWGAVYVLAEYDESKTMKENLDRVERLIDEQLAIRPLLTE